MSPLSRQDTTDDSGNYYVSDIEPGTYTVEASKLAYDRQLDTVEVSTCFPVQADFMLERSICPYTPGDVNGDGGFNGLDVVYMVAFFKGGSAPAIDCHPYCPYEPNPFYAAGDVNGDCVFSGLDIVFFVNILNGGPHISFCPECPPGR